MKGDFSRRTFDAKKHYSGVLMQQGRVQVDADWNEQQAINIYRAQTEATDVIGPCGAPADDAGFEIAVKDGKTLTIGAGRYYVDGILCENDQDELPFEQQPDLPLTGSAQSVLETLQKQQASVGLVYLDVWMRHITALDDDLIREKALGGPDTATRVKNVWQVKVLPIKSFTRFFLAELKRVSAEMARLEKDAKAESLKRSLADLVKLAEKAAGEKGDTLAASEKIVSEMENVQQKLTSLADGLEDRAEREALQRLAVEIDAAFDAYLAEICQIQFPEWQQLLAHSTGLLSARAQPADNKDDPCLLPPSAGYTRLENQLYRVEVHTGGEVKSSTPSSVTFKWSRDNGSVVSAVENLSSAQLTMHDVGPDSVLGFAVEQWVEVLDDLDDLNGAPGELLQIDDVNASTRAITLKSAPLLVFSQGRHPKLRRWDQSGSTATIGGIKVTGDWQPLEDGVEVQFAAGTYKTGDYWLIPARTATGQIEWPPFDPTLAPLALPPIGIKHHFCKLAVVDLQRTKDKRDLQLAFVADCRDIFRGLAEPPDAMHVISTSWENDSELDIRTLILDGLYVYLDAVPDSRSVKSDTMIVTAERPLASDPFSFALESLILVGTIETFANVIHWTLDFGQKQGSGGIGRTFDMESFAAFARAVAARQDSFRLRVTLKGRCIWAEPFVLGRLSSGNSVRILDALAARTHAAIAIGTLVPGRPTHIGPEQKIRTLRYLDGQAFGLPETTPAPHIGLTFPSGAGVRGSDFESWFFVGARRRANTLQVKGVEFHQFVPGQMDRTVVTVNQFPPAQPVSMLSEDQVNQIRVTFTRAVMPQGDEKIGTPQIARVIFISDAGGEEPMLSDVQVKGDVATILVRGRNTLNQTGKYRLNVFASSTQGQLGVTAQDDNSTLDGDFDNAAGGDFALPFSLSTNLK